MPLIGHDASSLFDRICQLGGMAQVIGPHGSGKSTLLSHLAREARIRGESVLVVRASSRRLPSWRGSTLLIVDEADTLPRWRRALLRVACRLRGTKLLLCVHAESGLPTLVRMAPQLSTTRRVVDHLCEGCSVTPPDDGVLQGLMERHAGDVRSVLFALYDRHEQGQAGTEGER